MLAPHAVDIVGLFWWISINIVLGMGKERWIETPYVGKNAKFPTIFDQDYRSVSPSLASGATC